MLRSIAFPLAPALGSIDSADSCLSLFADLPATMAGSDFSSPCVIGFGSSSLPDADRPFADGQP